MNLSEKKAAYAQLVVRTGLNLSPGQAVELMAGFDEADFVRLVVKECYEAGAGRVIVHWLDQAMDVLHYRYQKASELNRVMPWEVSEMEWQSHELPARLWLDSDDPDALTEADPAKVAASRQARGKIAKVFRDLMESRHQWCIAGVPGVKWAQKVFPGLEEKEAVEKLWNAILAAARADNGDPAENWRKHNAALKRRCDRLNGYNFASLEYSAANGTSFKVGLMPEGRFAAGTETDLTGRIFNPNIPSEEVFTSPKRGLAEGKLVASMPLVWNGVVIEDFELEFKDGKAVSCRAAKGEETLRKLLEMDENAPYLGECALIGKSSPIHQSGILFYSTLFDENAACHFALGRGFNECVQDFDKRTPEEIKALGVNDSMLHLDFMIGTEDLQVDGITPAGERIAIFRQGDWCGEFL